MSDTHVCEIDRTCACYALADTPNESCPVHGWGKLTRRCVSCGRFLPDRHRAPASAEARGRGEEPQP